MNIYFYNSEDGALLGSVSHSLFDRVLVPAFKADSHDMYLKYSFSGKKDILVWLVTDVAVNGINVSISLAQSEYNSSVADFAKEQSKNVEFYIKEFQIVEVDFGFYSNLFQNNGSLVPNKHYNSALLPGEMHKRRPCITLKSKGNTIQVIPLTTSSPRAGDKQSVPISVDSFKRLAPRYREEQSYALLSMMQTVSAHRVHPPRSDEFKYEHNYTIYRLSSIDKTRLKDALGEQYTSWIVNEKNLLQSKFNQLDIEKKRLFSKVQDLQNKELEYKEKLENIEDSFRKLCQYVDIECESLESAQLYINNELV